MKFMSCWGDSANYWVTLAQIQDDSKNNSLAPVYLSAANELHGEENEKRGDLGEQLGDSTASLEAGS